VITASVAIGSIGVPFLVIAVVLVSIPVIAVVAHDAAAQTESCTTQPAACARPQEARADVCFRSTGR
jgi:hypothetical protein